MGTVGARPTSVSRRQVLAATAALAATNVVSEFAPAAPRAISIDGGPQLFVDDHLIADSSLERKWHLPEIQRGPILLAETALELNGGIDRSRRRFLTACSTTLPTGSLSCGITRVGLMGSLTPPAPMAFIGPGPGSTSGSAPIAYWQNATATLATDKRAGSI